jgi:hypothetical protein
MGDRTNCGGGNRCFVEVEAAEQLCPCRKFRIDARAAGDVEAEDGSWQQMIPKVQWEVFVNAGEGSDEVIFESTDCALSSIPTMHSRWNKLKVCVFFVTRMSVLTPPRGEKKSGGRWRATPFGEGAGMQRWVHH